MKLFRAVIGVVASFALVFSGSFAAKASGESLTLSEFQSSPGYQLLSDEASATAIFMSNAGAVQITTTSSMDISGTPASGSILELKSSKTKSQAKISNTNAGETVGTPLIGTFDGTLFYGPVSIASTTTGVINYDAAIARLNKSTATVLAMPTTAVPNPFTKYKPAWVYSAAQLDPLARLTEGFSADSLGNVAGLLFSTVEPQANADNPSSTDYVFTASSPATGQTPPYEWVVTTTFNESHVFVSQTLRAVVVDITVNIVTELSTPASIEFAAVDKTQSVALSSLVTMGRKIAAEKSLAAKAKSLATKATALAKATRKALTVTQLKSAAKTLKLSTVALKTGVKLTAKYQGVAGSVCVTAVKGKAVTAHC